RAPGAGRGGGAARRGAPRRGGGGVCGGGAGGHAGRARPARGGTPRYRVISGVTGRTVADLGAWQLETTLTTTNPATWALNGPAGGGLLLSLYSGGQTWFQLLDVATMRSALLGVVPGRYSYCSAAGRYLACAGNGGL